MRTRCPACSTTFRVTSEQLRLKSGKVRCGQCLAVFNAFESLIEEETPIQEAVVQPVPIPEAVKVTREESKPLIPEPPPPTPAAPEEKIASPIRASISLPDPATEPHSEDESAPESEEKPEAEPVTEEILPDATQAAREAGLVAARELAETPAYNRWAAGTLAGDSHNRFDADEPEQARWPFLIAAMALFLLLAAQLLHHFRTELSQRFPELRSFYELAAVDLPLPRDSELVGIEVSDLQADPARGMLVLQATLRNRATFSQAWPHLELTLTDARDTVISRRVLPPAEYLPPETKGNSFPGRSDLAIRLWLEAKDVGASGYRLYLFYP